MMSFARRSAAQSVKCSDAMRPSPQKHNTQSSLSIAHKQQSQDNEIADAREEVPSTAKPVRKKCGTKLSDVPLRLGNASLLRRRASLGTGAQVNAKNAQEDTTDNLQLSGEGYEEDVWLMLASSAPNLDCNRTIKD
jgi:hypothetical protein